MKAVLQSATILAALIWAPNLVFAVSTATAKTSLPPVSTSSNPNAIEKMWNSNEVAKRVGQLLFRQDEYQPVYDAHYAKAKEHPNEPFSSPYKYPEWDRVLEAEQAILHDRSSFGDYAIVQATAIMRGGAEAEDVSCEIRKRGKRMLPILKYALSRPLCIGRSTNTDLLKDCQTYIETNKDDPKMDCQ